MPPLYHRFPPAANENGPARSTQKTLLLYRLRNWPRSLASTAPLLWASGAMAARPWLVGHRLAVIVAPVAVDRPFRFPPAAASTLGGRPAGALAARMGAADRRKHRCAGRETPPESRPRRAGRRAGGPIPTDGLGRSCRADGRRVPPAPPL